jgi:hypothetical protein
MPAKNIAEIHDAVVAALSKNPKVVNNRRKAIAALEEGKAKGLKLPLQKRRNVWFSTTQTDTISAQGVTRVQVLGIEVGQLKLNEDKTCFIFYPDGKKFPAYLDKKWKWSKDAKDAVEIRRYLTECKKHQNAKPENEREIQWQLANALGDGKFDAFRWLQPVTWSEHFTEIGVSVTKLGEAGTGNIDLMVRRGRTPETRGYLVFEVKAPSETDVKDPLEQALRYATALHFETEKGTPEDRENYTFVFGAKKSKKELNIGAVIVMKNSPEVRLKAATLIDQYCRNRGKSKIDRIGVLLYDFDGHKVTGWEWLDEKRDPRGAQLW